MCVCMCVCVMIFKNTFIFDLSLSFSFYFQLSVFLLLSLSFFLSLSLSIYIYIYIYIYSIVRKVITFSLSRYINKCSENLFKYCHQNIMTILDDFVESEWIFLIPCLMKPQVFTKNKSTTLKLDGQICIAKSKTKCQRWMSEQNSSG